MRNIKIIIGVVLLVLLVWGLIGSSEAAEIGINCDFGIGDDGSVFCWKWHQNVIGDISDILNQ
nr:hypothetical protein [Nanoarchaeum sp.]